MSPLKQILTVFTILNFLAPLGFAEPDISSPESTKSKVTRNGIEYDLSTLVGVTALLTSAKESLLAGDYVYTLRSDGLKFSYIQEVGVTYKDILYLKYRESADFSNSQSWYTDYKPYLKKVIFTLPAELLPEQVIQRNDISYDLQSNLVVASYKEEVLQNPLPGDTVALYVEDSISQVKKVQVVYLSQVNKSEGWVSYRNHKNSKDPDLKMSLEDYRKQYLCFVLIP